MILVVTSEAARQTLLRTPGQGAGRLGRVALLAAVPLLLGSGAHLLGGGTLPLLGVLLAVAGLVPVSVAASGRQCRFPLLVALLGVDQVGLHLLFTAASTSAMCIPGGSMPNGHVSHPGAGGTGLTSVTALPACAQEHAMTTGWMMIAAHVLATVLAAWLLARGEAWWWRTVAELTRIVSARPTQRRARLVPIMARASRVNVAVAMATASPRGPPLPS